MSGAVALDRGIRLPAWTWRWAEHARVVRSCKLHDFDNRRWLAFAAAAACTTRVKWRVNHAQ